MKYAKLKSAPMPIKMIYRGIEESGKTLEQIANESGVAESSINDWFARGRLPSLRNYMAVANSIGLEVTLSTGKSC